MSTSCTLKIPVKRKYVKLLLLLFIQIIPCALALAQEGQSHLKDSLTYLLQSSEKISQDDPQKSLKLAFQAFDLSSKINGALDKGEIYKAIAQAYGNLEQYDSAANYYEKTIALLNKQKPSKTLCKNYKALGNCYWYTGQYKKSWGNYQEALRIAKKRSLHDLIIRIYHNLGLILNDQGNYKKAIDYHKKALDNGAQDYVMAHVYNSIGNSYENLEKYDEALAWFEKSLALFDELDDSKNKLTPLSNISGLLYAQGQYKKALEMSLQLKEACKSLGLKSELIMIYNRIGLIYKQLNQYDRALNYHNKSLQLAKETNYSHTHLIYANIAFVHEAQGNYRDAYYQIMKHKELGDSIFSIKKNKAIEELRAKYETREKQAEIDSLEMEKAYMDLQAEKETTFRNAVIIGAILLLLPALILAVVYRQKLKSERQLAFHKEEANKRRVAEQERVLEIQTIKAGIDAQEKEKQRIAAELHDSVAGSLAGIKHSLAKIVKDENRTNKFDGVIEHIDKTYNEVRTLSHHLTPPIILKTNLILLMKKYLNETSETHNIQISFSAYPENHFAGLPKEIQTEIYRITQESINNIIKHAHAKHVDVSFTSHEDAISLMIEDDGLGFNVKNNSEGLGLNNIRSRVGILHGELYIDSVPGRGTIISVDIPFVNKSTQHISKENVEHSK